MKSVCGFTSYIAKINRYFALKHHVTSKCKIYVRECRLNTQLYVIEACVHTVCFYRAALHFLLVILYIYYKFYLLFFIKKHKLENRIHIAERDSS